MPLTAFFAVGHCWECPCCSEHDHGTLEKHCAAADDGCVDTLWRDDPPPQWCPLRKHDISIAYRGADSV